MGGSNRALIATLLLPLLAFGACADPPAADDATAHPKESTRLQIDSAVYTLRPDRNGLTTTIPYRYHNTSADTVYVVNCNQHVTMFLEKLEAGIWKTFWASPTNGCLSPPILIAPGEEFAGREVIWGAAAGNTSTTAFVSNDFTGRFRLMWHHVRHHYSPDAPNFGDTLDVQHRVSNEFGLRQGQ